MSHFSAIKTKMNNRRALVAALEEMGYQVECHETPQNLRSVYQGDGYRQANVIVRREQMGIGVDLGYLQGKDGNFSMVSDRMYVAVMDVSTRIKHLYAKHVILQKSGELGHDCTVTEKLDVNGQFIGWQVTVEPQDLQYMGINNTYNSASLLSQY